MIWLACNLIFKKNVSRFLNSSSHLVIREQRPPSGWRFQIFDFGPPGWIHGLNSLDLGRSVGHPMAISARMEALPAILEFGEHCRLAFTNGDGRALLAVLRCHPSPTCHPGTREAANHNRVPANHAARPSLQAQPTAHCEGRRIPDDAQGMQRPRTGRGGPGARRRRGGLAPRLQLPGHQRETSPHRGARAMLGSCSQRRPRLLECWPVCHDTYDVSVKVTGSMGSFI